MMTTKNAHQVVSDDIPYEILYAVSCGETCLYWAFAKTTQNIIYALPQHMHPHIASLLSFSLSYCLQSRRITPWQASAEKLQETLEVPSAFLFVYDFVQHKPVLCAEASFPALFGKTILGSGLADTIERVFLQLYETEPHNAHILYTYGSYESKLLQVQTTGNFPQDPAIRADLRHEVGFFALRVLFFTAIRLLWQSYIYISEDLREFVLEHGFMENTIHKNTAIRALIRDINTIFNDEMFSIDNCLTEVFRIFQYRTLFNGTDYAKEGEDLYLNPTTGQFRQQHQKNSLHCMGKKLLEMVVA